MTEFVVPAVELLAIITVVGLACLLGGYSWGRKVGQHEGEQLGRTAAPIELRQIALERGQCSVCGANITRSSRNARSDA